MIINNQGHDVVGNDPLGRGPKKAPPPPQDDTSFRPGFIGADGPGGPMFPDATFVSDKHPSGKVEMSPLDGAQRHKQIQMQQQQATPAPQRHHPPMTSRSSSSTPGTAYPMPQSTRSMPAMPHGHNDFADSIPPSPMQIYMSSSNANSSGTRRDQSTHYSMPSSHRSNNSENTRGEVGARPSSPNELGSQNHYARDRDIGKQDEPFPHPSSHRQQPYYQRQQQQPRSIPEQDSYFQQDKSRICIQDTSLARPYPYDERQGDHPQPTVNYPHRNPYQNNLNEQKHGLSYRGHNSPQHNSYITHNNNSNFNSREERDMPPRSYGSSHGHAYVQNNSQEPPIRLTPSRQAYDGIGPCDEGQYYQQPLTQEYSYSQAQHYLDGQHYRRHSDGRGDDRRLVGSESLVAHHNDGYIRNRRHVTQSKHYDIGRICSGDDGYIKDQKDRRNDKRNGWPPEDHRDHDYRPRYDGRRSSNGYNPMERYDDERNRNGRYPRDNDRPLDSDEPRLYDERRYDNRRHLDENRPSSGDHTPPHGGPWRNEGPGRRGDGAYSHKPPQPLSPLSIPTCINGPAEESRFEFSEVRSPQNTEAACSGSYAENRAPRRDNFGGAEMGDYGVNPIQQEGHRNGVYTKGQYRHDTHPKVHLHDKNGRDNDRYDANFDEHNPRARRSYHDSDNDARNHIPRQVAVYQKNSKSSSGNDDRYNDNYARPPRAPPPDRRDDYSGSSTIHTPSTFTPKQRQGSSERRQQASPPPPPSAHEYANTPPRNDPSDNNLYSRSNLAGRTRDDRHRHSSEDTHQRKDSRLSIEIPVTPQIHNGNNEQPACPQSDHGGSQTPAAQQRPSHGQDHRDKSQRDRPILGSNPPQPHYATGKSTPRIMHAEAERRQSHARHQIMKEIAQATNMRNSALDEDDRKFWERQIATLNESFRKL